MVTIVVYGYNIPVGLMFAMAGWNVLICWGSDGRFFPSFNQTSRGSTSVVATL